MCNLYAFVYIYPCNPVWASIAPVWAFTAPGWASTAPLWATAFLHCSRLTYRSFKTAYKSSRWILLTWSNIHSSTTSQLQEVVSMVHDEPPLFQGELRLLLGDSPMLRFTLFLSQRCSTTDTGWDLMAHSSRTCLYCSRVNLQEIPCLQGESPHLIKL